MKHFFKQALIFLSIIVIPLMGIEISLQGLKPYQWFHGYSNLFRNSKVDTIFLGNSIIDAAVCEKEFAADISEKGKPDRNALNLGMGYTSPVEYLFGLETMVNVNPHAFEGATIIMPATGGLPDIRTWSDNWMNWHQPALLTDYISYPNLWRYCMMKEVSLPEKVLVVAGKHSELISQGLLLRAGTMYSLDEAAEWLTHWGKISKKGALIVQGERIRTDDVAVANFQDHARRQAEADLKDQKPIDWDATVLKDIVKFVQAHGGKVAFCYIPVGSVMMKPLLTETRQKDMRNFEKAAKEWGCKYYKPNFKPQGDQDFPDLMHLSEPRSHAYTKALTEAYLRDPP